MTACIVIPCFNEAARLDEAQFHAFVRAEPLVSFLFVDDGSTDLTRAKLSELARAEPRFALLALDSNQGKAEAVRRGMLAALASSPRFVGYWDADLATPLAEIPRFLALLEQKPELWLAMGARVSLLGRAIERSAGRHYLGRVFATCASSVLKLPVYDTQCGAKVFRASSDLEAILREPFLSRWIFDVEILARLVRRAGSSEVARRVAELPLDAWRDMAGSKVQPLDFVRAARELWAIKSRYLRG